MNLNHGENHINFIIFTSSVKLLNLLPKRIKPLTVLSVLAITTLVSTRNILITTINIRNIMGPALFTVTKISITWTMLKYYHEINDKSPQT